MNDHPLEFEPAPPAENRPTIGDPESTETTSLASSLPRELGVMLVSAGLIGVVLPGPGTPALLAGGLILWPQAFNRAERWFQRRFPGAHRQGMGHINRFLNDLERRYPGSTGSDPDKAAPEHP
jgi:hypothetical protein